MGVHEFKGRNNEKKKGSGASPVEGRATSARKNGTRNLNKLAKEREGGKDIPGISGEGKMRRRGGRIDGGRKP